MREIGSEFWSVPVSSRNNGFFPSSTEWFVSGRNALKAIIKELKNCRSVELPAWCCDSMIEPFVSEGFSVRFYSVMFQDGFKQKPNFNCDILFVMDYFGFETSEKDLKNYNGIVIRDLTHSVFTRKYSDADYYFGSLRKWAGFWTGGFAYGFKKTVVFDNNDMGFALLRKQAMEDKEIYIESKESDLKPEKKFLSVFNAAENLLDRLPISQSNRRDINIANKLDIGSIKFQRRKNAEILIQELNDICIFKSLRENDCPLFVPIIIRQDKRDKLKSFLIKESIFCPVHWPLTSYHNFTETACNIYNRELSLVCDQRYGAKDMDRIVETVKRFCKEEKIC